MNPPQGSYHLLRKEILISLWPNRKGEKDFLQGGGKRRVTLPLIGEVSFAEKVDSSGQPGDN